MLEEYNCEFWHGGKVRHIVRDKIIYLERGQVFKIGGKKFFIFGGASSHDVQGGILNPADSDYAQKRIAAIQSGLPYRIKGKSWWWQELPTESEMLEYKKWYCGHYHVNRIMDQKHIVLFEEIIPLEW